MIINITSGSRQAACYVYADTCHYMSACHACHESWAGHHMPHNGNMSPPHNVTQTLITDLSALISPGSGKQLTRTQSHVTGTGLSPERVYLSVHVYRGVQAYSGLCTRCGIWGLLMRTGQEASVTNIGLIKIFFYNFRSFRSGNDEIIDQATFI